MQVSSSTAVVAAPVRVQARRAWLTWAGPFQPLLRCVLLGVGLLTLSRLALAVWQWPRVEATGIWPEVLLQGLRVDLIMLGWIMALPVLLLPLLVHPGGARAWSWLVRIVCVGGLGFLCFMEMATPAYLQQFDARPDRLFIEYLVHPREVLAMLWQGYRPLLLLSAVVMMLASWGLWRWFRPAATAMQPGWSRRWIWLGWPLALLSVFAAIRSTTDHRPANPAMFALTSDQLVNDLILNSGWSLLQAAYAMRHEADVSAYYGHMDPQLALDIVRRGMQPSSGSPDPEPLVWTDPERPTLHLQTPTRLRARPLNLVILLQESIGATFVESLGGMAATPELEQLRQKGWWFERLYATGTRSARGIEAVVAGFMPTPARAVLKLSLAQSGFFTIGSLLKRHGYHTEFIYGGEAHFDQMRGFLTGNGFDHVVDRADFTEPAFIGSWGVSDGDLFAMTHARLQALYDQGQPFLVFAFTSSNHEPFEYPEGVILPVGPPRSVDNAVRYADRVMGDFFRQAEQSAYWADTVFLVVADHDVRVYGNQLVPVEKFHIPALLLGADIIPAVTSTITSQIDLAPTLLSVLGIAAEHPMVGRDLTRTWPDGGRAMLQFDDLYAWLEEDALTILRPERPPVAGHFDPISRQVTLWPDPPTQQRVQRALAHVSLASWLYREQRYGLPLQASDAQPAVRSLNSPRQRTTAM